MGKSRHSNFLAPVGLLIALLLFWGLSLKIVAPTIFVGDSSEFSAGAVNLGIAHPNGYPFFVVSGKLFSCLPLSNPGFRVNLASLFWGALSLVFVFLVCQRLSQDWATAIWLALCFVTAPLYWREQLGAEVYSLNLLFLSILTWLVLEEQKNIPVLLLVFFTALGVTNHYLIFLSLPALLLIMISRGQLNQPRPMLQLVLTALIGGSLYLYLPLRASAHPYLHWGDPLNWKNLLFFLKRGEYQTLEFGGQGGLVDKLMFASALLQDWVRQFHVLVLAALGGAYLCYQKRRREFWFLLVLLLFYSFCLIMTLQFKYSPREANRVSVYYFGSYLIILAFVAIAVDWLLKRIRPALVHVGLIVCFAGALLLNLPKLNYRNFYLTYDAALNVFASLPEGAYYFVEGDNLLLPAIYLQAAEGRRNDLKIMHAKYDFSRLVGLEQRWPAVKERVERKGHQLYYSYRPKRKGSVQGFVWTVASTQAPSEKEFRLRTAAGLDFMSGEMNAWNFYMLGMNQLRLGRPEAAAVHFELGIIGHPYYPENYLEVAQIYQKQGDFSKARNALEAGVLNNSDSDKLSNNLGVLCFKQADYEQAVEYYQQAVQLNPLNGVVWQNLGSAFYRQKLYQEALDTWLKALQYIPDDDNLKRNISITRQLLDK